MRGTGNRGGSRDQGRAERGQVGLGRNLAWTRAGACLRLDGVTIGSGINPEFDH